MNFKLPFPEFTLNTQVEIYYVAHNENNAETKTSVFNGLARYDRKTKTSMNAQRELITYTGLVVLKGYIDIPTDKRICVLISGDSVERKVGNVNQPTNPDGSIFSTELFLE